MDPKVPDVSSVEISGSGSIDVGGGVSNSEINTVVTTNTTNNYNVSRSLTQIPTTFVTDVLWPNQILGHTPDLANRDAEFDFFREMIAGQTNERALFIEAAGNHGKSTLVRECRRYLQVVAPSSYINIDFKAMLSRDSVLTKLRLYFGPMLAQFAHPDSSTFEMCANLRSLTHPTVLFFDAYEKASAETDEFIKTLLLSELQSLPAIRLVIAGQQVPDHLSSMWADNVRHFALGPISDPRKWERIANVHYPKLTSDHIFAVTNSSGGNPGYVRAGLQAVAIAIERSNDQSL